MTNSEDKITDSLQKARDHFEKKEFKNARLMYSMALNNTQDNKIKSIIWAELSWVFYYEQDFSKCIEAAENVLLFDENYKNLDGLYRVQGYAYLAIKNNTLAERYLSLSLKENDADDKQQFVKYELGKLHFTNGNYDLAYPIFSAILPFFMKADLDYGLSVLFYLGFIYYYLNNMEKSREFFDRILDESSSPQREASAYFGIAFNEFREKNFLNVISLCEKIITLDENFFDKESLGFLTAASYYYLGRKDIFKKYFSQLMKTYPNGRYKVELEKMDKSDSPTQGS